MAITNVFQYAAQCEHNYRINYTEITGRSESRYTFFSDLSIAEFISGIEGIKDTIKRFLVDWKNNFEAVVEILMSINLKSWEQSALTDEKNASMRAFSKERHKELAEYYSNYYYTLRDSVVEDYKTQGRMDLVDLLYQQLD